MERKKRMRCRRRLMNRKIRGRRTRRAGGKEEKVEDG
jgi:hypothetical protein